MSHEFLFSAESRTRSSSFTETSKQQQPPQPASSLSPQTFLRISVDARVRSASLSNIEDKKRTQPLAPTTKPRASTDREDVLGIFGPFQ